MFRKRKNPTAGFRGPVPFLPQTGEHAELMVPGVSPNCALMQIAEHDTHRDYVICRGYDTRIKRFIDYDPDDTDNNPGIPVAKPWGKRMVGLYRKFAAYPAVLPLSKFGQNPLRLHDSFRIQNVGVDTIPQNGQQYFSSAGWDNFRETVVHLKTDEDIYINWMLLDGGPTFVWAMLTDALAVCDSADAVVLRGLIQGAGFAHHHMCPIGQSIGVRDLFGVVANSPLAVDNDADGIGDYIPAYYTVLLMAIDEPDLDDPNDYADPYLNYICHWAPVTFGMPCCEGYE